MSFFKGVTLLIAIFFITGCATSGVMATPHPDVRDALMRQRIGIAGCPASEFLKESHIEAETEEVEKPVAADQATIQAFLRDKKLDSLVVVTQTCKEESEPGVNTAVRVAAKVAVIGVRVGTAILGGAVGSDSSGTVNPSRDTNLLTSTIIVYGNDGTVLLNEKEKWGCGNQRTQKSNRRLIIRRAFNPQPKVS